MSIDTEAGDNEVAVQMDTAVMEYYDKFIAPIMGEIPDDAKATLRARYVEAAKKNPVALWSIARWYFWPVS